HGWFKRILGIIFILVAIGILTGYDKKLQVSLLDAGFFDVTKVEQGLLDFKTNNLDKEASKNLEKLNDAMNGTVDNDNGKEVGGKKEGESKQTFLNVEQKNKKFTLAPDLSTIDGYINTDGQPITISE